MHRLGSNRTVRMILMGAAMAVLGIYTQSCQNGSSDPSGPDALPGILFTIRSVDSIGNPLDPIEFTPGGDLYSLVPATPSGKLRNLTRNMTNGEGDVSDPEIFPQTSGDRYRVVFSMKRSASESWHLYEAEVAADGSLASGPDPLTCGASNEVDPVYLPDGRIVFSSDRPGHLDEYERRKSTVLHVLDRSAQRLNGQPDCDSGEVVQISFNQSHDRNPIVLRDGSILFSRWEHLGRVNKFAVFFAEPDGTGLFVKFGSHSGVNSFLDLRERPDGKLVATMMPLSGTYEGGAIGLIDMVNEADDPDTADLQLTLPQVIPTGRVASDVGRYHNVYPVPDGTDRYIASYSTGLVVDLEPNEDGTQPPEEEPHYGIWMIDNGKGTLKPILLPSVSSRKAYVDPVPLMNVPDDWIPVSKPLETANRSSLGSDGVLGAASVYDSEANRALSNSVLGVTIPRGSDGHIDFNALLADPSLQVVREVRIIAAVPSRPGVGVEDIGLTRFERQRILGYAPVEADGSFRVVVPADTSLTLNVVDARRRSFKVKENWLQVRSGETRTCNGCHSPRRGDPERLATESIALNRAPSVLTPPTVDVIDYADHIQPMFDVNCVSCHSIDLVNNPDGPAGGLDLGSDVSGAGFPISYTALLSDDMGESDWVIAGESQQSHLIERMFGEELRAAGDVPASDPVGHDTLLTDDQKELLVEWIDLGAQFSNLDVIANPGRLGLDETTFTDTVAPILQDRCAGCHQPDGSSNFVLTGDMEGDFGAVIARVNVTNPESSILLLKADGEIPMVDNGSPVAPPPITMGDADYTAILNWIQAAQ
jgi:mono/diheme cytochrome c family protein